MLKLMFEKQCDRTSGLPGSRCNLCGSQAQGSWLFTIVKADLISVGTIKPNV